MRITPVAAVTVEVTVFELALLNESACHINCTYPLAQPIEKSIDWGWLPGHRLVQGMYDQQAKRRSM